MKRYTILFLYFLFSCHEAKDTLCLANLKYIKHEKTLGSPYMIMDFIDSRRQIEKVIKKGEFKNIIFYSLYKNEDSIFCTINPYYFEKKGVYTRLNIGTSFFMNLNRLDWTEKQVETFLLKRDVGLVLKKDTIRIKNCNCNPASVSVSLVHTTYIK